MVASDPMKTNNNRKKTRNVFWKADLLKFGSGCHTELDAVCCLNLFQFLDRWLAQAQYNPKWITLTVYWEMCWFLNYIRPHKIIIIETNTLFYLTRSFLTPTSYSAKCTNDGAVDNSVVCLRRVSAHTWRFDFSRSRSSICVRSLSLCIYYQVH